MKNYAALDLPVNIKQDSFDPKTIQLQPNMRWSYAIVDPAVCLTKESIDFFTDLVGGNIMCQLHKGLPGDVMPIHVDGRVQPDGSIRCPREWAVNITWGSTSSEMFWYDLTEEAKISRPPSSNNNTNLFPGYSPGWKDSDVVEIDRCVLSGPTLINLNIPHHVKNYDTINTRWALTIRADVSVLSYSQAYQLFAPYYK